MPSWPYQSVQNQPFIVFNLTFLKTGPPLLPRALVMLLLLVTSIIPPTLTYFKDTNKVPIHYDDSIRQVFLFFDICIFLNIYHAMYATLVKYLSRSAYIAFCPPPCASKSTCIGKLHHVLWTTLFAHLALLNDMSFLETKSFFHST
jgi:hypothetical protein